ncbi:ABC transporter substrate-binding protein [Reyranella sp.]|jgi:putative ABC transport system substrate-binding protein|uniref:ABC transporter substrate-binding protein n=1 Tax=Reyranella sp. TaxID=1929291 RepID=UPI002F95D6E9
MRRRRFIPAVGVALATVLPYPGRAQKATVPVIGYLRTVEPTPETLRAFTDGLAQAGYVEGKTVRIEHRFADGRYDRLPALAAELVRAKVDVLVTTGGTTTALAAKTATGTIPIVALMGFDPMSVGLATSFSHPGGNVTGVAQLVNIADGKRLEFVHAIVPAARTVAYLTNPELPYAKRQIDDIADKARGLGVELAVLKASDEAGLDAAFAAIDRDRIGALVVGADPFFFAARGSLVARSNRRALPTIYFFREFAAAGGLASYGTDLRDGYRALAPYVAKILKGAKPADLPIAQQSERIELVVNLKTARELGIPIPTDLLARADEVLE